MAQIDTLTNVGAVVSTDLALILRGGANVLGTFGSLVGQNSTAVTITGGTINGTTIGATTPASVAATTLSTTGAATVGSTLGVTGAATFSSTVRSTGYSLTDATSQYYHFDAASGNNFMGLTAAHTLTTYTNGVARTTLDASGNLGLGVVPSAWSTAYFKVIEGAGGSSLGFQQNANGVLLGSNNYLDSGVVSRYVVTDEASKYYQTSGVHTWSSAASGTAGAEITWTDSMTLDASGNLGLGVVPSAWGSYYSTINAGSAGNLSFFTGQTNAPVVNVGVNLYNDNTNFRYAATGAASFYQQYVGEHRWYNVASGGVGNIATPVQAMTLDASGNLGIGTSSATSIAGFNKAVKLEDAANASYVVSGGVHEAEFAVSSDGGWLGTSTSIPQRFVTNGTERMRLDVSGNLGVGVIPQASPQESRLDVLTATNAGVQVRASTTGTGNGTTEVTSIRTVNLGADDWAVNRTNGYSHVWGVGATPPSSSAMTLDASGNLLVGTTSPSAKLTVEQASANANGATIKNQTVDYQTLGLHNAATSGDNFLVSFTTDASSFRGSITYNRAGGLIAYNTTSDYRAKDISGPVTDSGVLIDSTPVYMGKMKGATQERPMFIAHEVPAYAHTGEKDAVDADGNPIYQQMDVSALVPVMWAEIQSLRARLEALEGAK